MTKLISGRVAKVNSANVSADRYEFLSLDEAEPDLGLPTSEGQVFTSNVTGTRSWLTLNTTNVVEAINLYYTNARVITAVTPTLTTANVLERAGNLYFTNARVVSALTAGQNITIEANGRISATAAANVSAAEIRNALTNATVPGNLTVTGRITSNGLIVNGIEIVTGGSNEANIVATRITANIWNNLYTANVIETSGNLYFTNSRVVSALIAGQNITIEANGRISAVAANTSTILASLTDSTIRGNLTVTELLTSNSLIVNGPAEIKGNLKVGLGIGGNILGVNFMTAENFLANTTTANNMVIYGNVVIGTGSGGSITDAYLISADYVRANVMYANSISTNSIIVNGLEIVSGSTLEANIIVARLTANIITTNTIIVNGLEIVNGTSGEANLAVSKITANIIFANNFVLNGVPISNLQSQVNNLTTDQVAEGTNNLYYTNSRARTAYTAGQNITIAANGRIDASTSAILGSLAESSIQGNLRVTGTVTANGFVSTGVGVPTLVSSSNINIIASSGEVTITTKNLRVAGNLIVTNSITANSITINGIEIVTGGTNEANIAATRINTNSITANIWNNLYTSNIIDNLNVFSNTNSIAATVIPFLTTANVVELPGNLYYTNSRVLSAVNPLLTTANVVESTNNLYYTNSRVRSAFSGGTGVTYDSIAGTISIGQDVATTSDVVFKNLSLNGNLYILGNLVSVFANTLTVSDPMIQLGYGNPGDSYDLGFIGHYYDGATERHAGLIRDHTDGKFKFFNNLVTEPGSNDLDTGHDSFRYANLVVQKLESNLLVTDTITANSFNSPGGDITIRGNLIPSVDSVFSLGTSANRWKDVYLYATSVYLGNTQLSSNSVTGGLDVTTPTGAKLDLSTANLFASGLIYGDLVGRVSTLSNHTTSNLAEGTNLYFTNTRVVSALIAGQNIIIEANGRISANITTTLANLQSQISNLTTDQIPEGTVNLYYTNSRVVSAFTAGDNIIIESNGRISANVTTTIANLQSQISGLTTDQIAEGTTNKYFTNSRAILAVIPAATQLTVTTPVFNYNIDQYSGDNPTIYVNAGETISFNLDIGASHPFNIRVSNGGSNYDTGLTHIANDGTVSTGSSAQGKVTGKLFWKVPYSLAGSTYVYQCSNHGSMVGDIVIQRPVSTITTANVAENTNLYFTAARALSAVNPRLTTANVIEEPNFVGFINEYFTNVRAVTAITSSGILTTANVIETSGNLYFTNTRVLSALTNENVQVENLYANSTIYANALIIRNISVTDTVLLGSNVSGGAFSGNSLVVESVTANVWNNLYTANVIETSGNLYFTNSRVVSALTAGQSIIIEANGRISANVSAIITAGENVTIEANGRLSVTLIPVTTINDSVRFVATGATTYNLNTLVNDPKNVLVIVEGLVQIPVVDYTVSGTSLILADAPVVGTNIEVRLFGVDTINSARALSAVVDTFVGDGSNIVYTLSSTPPNKNFVTVMIDGIYQQSDIYTLSGKNITFPEAPGVGANIDIRVIGGAAGSTYNTRTFTANGTVSSFALTEGFTRDTILVFENGVAQMPLTDYDVVNNSLIFTNPPAANVVVQVREMGISGISAANVIAAIRSLDQVTGNLVPTTNASKDLGSPSKNFNNLYLNQNGLVLSNVRIGATETALTITSSSNVTTTITSTQTLASRSFGLSLIFGG